MIIFYSFLKPVTHVKWCIRTCSLAFCCTAITSLHWYSCSLLVFVLRVLILSKWCFSCDLTKNMTVLWLIVGLGQWFLTFFFLHILSFYQTRSSDLPQYPQWCSFIDNTNITNSYSLELFRKMYINCNKWFSKLTPLEDEINPWWITGLGPRQITLLLHFVLNIFKSPTLIHPSSGTLPIHFLRFQPTLN